MCTRSSALWKPAVEDLGGGGPERAEAVRRRRARLAEVDRVREAGAQHRQQRGLVARGGQHAGHRVHQLRGAGPTRCRRRAPPATPARRRRRSGAGPGPRARHRPRWCPGGSGSRARRRPGRASRCAWTSRSAASAPSSYPRARAGCPRAPGAAATARDRAAAKSVTGSPSSASRVRSTSGDGVCSGIPRPTRRSSSPSRGTALSPTSRRGRVPRLADRDDPGGVGALLADAHRLHDPAVGQRQPLPAALVEREVGPDVGPRLEQPAHADVGRAVLLVGDRDQPEVAPRAEARTGELGHRHGAGRDLVLHVDRAPAPQPAALVDDGGERRVGPVTRVGRDHVEVTDERQRAVPRGPIRGCGPPGSPVAGRGRPARSPPRPR